MSESAVIRIEHDGVIGIGEAKMSADACGGVAEPVADYGDRARAILGNDPFQLERILDELERVLPDCCCTRAGIDIALHDLCGKLAGLPLYRWFGLRPTPLPPTSYTIGLDTVPRMLQKVQQASTYPVLKIKVGVSGDVALVKAIRAETAAVLRVDTNGGWSVAEAIERGEPAVS